jgi:hypothetical protein
MSKPLDVEVRRPAAAKLATKFQQAGMSFDDAVVRAKLVVTEGSRNRTPNPAQGGALFIHGPQGCGKTRNEAALCKFFGKRKAVDYDSTQRTYANNLIVFSNVPLPGSMPFKTAMSRAGLKA